MARAPMSKTDPQGKRLGSGGHSQSSQSSPPNPSPLASDRNALYALAGVIAAATLALVASQWTARTAFDAQMVQVGIGILSADPSKSDVAPARKWAIDLVEKHSGQPFSADDLTDLLHHPLQTKKQEAGLLCPLYPFC